MKKKDFIGSGGLLMIFMLAAKGIGALYRIPLTNIVGAEGMGLYQMIYPFYALLLTVASGGLPVAISKIVASKRDERASLKVLKVAVITLSVIGGVTAGFVLIFRKVIAGVQGNGKAALAYAGISPAVLIVCVISCLRGYFQGRKNMVPSGVSQIIEQVFKLVVGLWLAAAFMKRGVEYGVLGALLGVSVSELLALIFLGVCFLFSKRRYDRRTRIELAFAAEAGELVLPRPAVEEKAAELMKGIFRIALPVTLSSLVLPLTQVIDSVLIVNILATRTDVATATSLFGLINGPIGSLINMPTVLTMSLGVSLLPKIASSVGKKKAEYGSTALKLTLLIALPCTLIFMIFPEEILTVLYSRGLSREQISTGAGLLRLGSLSVTYISLIQVATSCLQGVDRAHLPAINLIIGAVIKILLTLALIGFMSITGAMLASVSCYAVTALMDFICLRRHFPLKGSAKWLWSIPLAVTSFAVFKLLLTNISFTYSEIVFIAAGILVYLIGIFGLRLIRLGELFN